MKPWWVATGVILLTLVGCMALGEWMAPMEKRDMSAAYQKILDARDATIRSLEAQIEKLKNAALPKVMIPAWAYGALYVLSALAIVGGPIFFGGVMKDLMMTALSVFGGGCLFGALWLRETYPWAIWIPVILMSVTAVLLGYKYYVGQLSSKALPQVIQGAQKLKDAVASAIPKDTANRILAAAQTPDVSKLVVSLKDKLGLGS